MTRVLIANRRDDYLRELARELRARRHEVIAASRAETLQDLLHTGRFDVVASEMDLPGLAGADLLAIAARMEPAVQVILTTTDPGAMMPVLDDHLRSLLDFLVVPAGDLDRLCAAVTNAVERRDNRVQIATLSRDLGARLRELEDTRARLAALTERDPVTGLLNHTALHRRLVEAVRRSWHGVPALMLTDMDGFRSINETYGHEQGDRVLQHIGACLRATCSSNADIARSCGDEFMVLFSGENAQAAAFAAERARGYLSANPYVNPQGTRIPIAMSFGIADASTASPDATALISAARTALEEGKARGGDRVALHLERIEDFDTPHWSEYSVLDGLVTAIDNKDRYTRRHSEDVARFAVMIGEAVGLSGEARDALHIAGLLHDVGKIGMPDAVLLKPGKLSGEEMDAMRAHVTLSRHILQSVPGMQHIIEAVGNHHERWDGKGYPDGLSGDEIPLAGRILAIADCFSAMTLDRRYRTALSREDAVREIERGAGTQFDPLLARLFVDLQRARQEQPRMELPYAA